MVYYTVSDAGILGKKEFRVLLLGVEPISSDALSAELQETRGS